MGPQESMGPQKNKSCENTHNDATTEIADSLNSNNWIENVLIGVPPTEIEIVKKYIDEKDLQYFFLLTKKGINISPIYDKIIDKFYQKYLENITNGGTLSKYWTDEIIESNNSKYIFALYYRLSNNKEYTGLNINELKEILEKIREFYLRGIERSMGDMFKKEEDNSEKEENDPEKKEKDILSQFYSGTGELEYIPIKNGIERLIYIKSIDYLISNINNIDNEIGESSTYFHLNKLSRISDVLLKIEQHIKNMRISPLDTIIDIISKDKSGDYDVSAIRPFIPTLTKQYKNLELNNESSQNSQKKSKILKRIIAKKNEINEKYDFFSEKMQEYIELTIQKIDLSK